MPTNTNRTASSYRGRSTASEVKGSLLDQRRPPALPEGLDPDVERIAARILRLNPHLWFEHQVQPVVRLANIYYDIEQMTASIRQVGWWVQNVNGDFKANPLIASRSSLMTSALNLERSLMITSYHRAQTTESEQRLPAGLDDDPVEAPSKTGRASARVLRLA